MKLPISKPNLVDRVIEVFAPERALARSRARTMLALSGSGSGYAGADRTRRAQRYWDPRPNSADQATLPDLANLRSASRDLIRNNPLAAGAINTVTTSVVGTGLGVQPQIAAQRLRLTADEARAWQQQAKDLFELWAVNALWCDITGQLTFYEQQELCFRSALESGDAFALLPIERIADEPFGTKVQLIEADRVCNPDNKPDNDTTAAGIEVDARGRALRFHVADRHPGAYLIGGNNWTTIEAFGARTGRRNILHLTTRLRPGQRRGVPYLATVIEPLKQLGTYTDAEITAAVISGMFTVFVKKEAEHSPLSQPVAGTAPAPGTTASDEVNLEAGAMVDLAPGEDIALANPMRPNAGFDPFVMAILRQIGVALELPFELLIKHFTASYSASRAAMLEAWRFYRRRRAWLTAQFCQPVYEAVLWEAVANGRLRAPGFLRDPLIRAAYCRAQWIGDAPGALNPMDEARAAEKRIEIGISSISKESVAHDGSNWEDNHQQQVLEAQARKRDGLGQLPAASAVPAPPSNPEPARRQDESTEKEE